MYLLLIYSSIINLGQEGVLCKCHLLEICIIKMLFACAQKEY